MIRLGLRKFRIETQGRKKERPTVFASLRPRARKFVVEEVVTQDESVTVPVKGIEGNRSAFPDSDIRRCVGASFRWYRILSVIAFVFSEIIPHSTKILSCMYSVISMFAYNVVQYFVLLFVRL